ncbi:MAG: hypothetical protein OXU20_16435 [Myxococcales bacterium]|nr:hypothetical protein [Myxococcales bacterium]
MGRRLAQNIEDFDGRLARPSTPHDMRVERSGEGCAIRQWMRAASGFHDLIAPLGHATLLTLRLSGVGMHAALSEASCRAPLFK